MTYLPALKRLGFLVAASSLTFGLARAAPAEDDPWTLRVEPVFVDVSGHDPTLLSIRGGASGDTDLNLETESGLGYHLELRRTKGGRWNWGVDSFWFTATQNTPSQTASAASDGAPVVFEIADGGFTSTGPDQVLFFDRLSDTDMNVWTVDLFALRALPVRPSNKTDLLLGLRNADFDNDNRAVTGIQGVGGTRLDASSNYGRMIGPIVGLLSVRERGKNRFEGQLTQSVVFGDAELTSSQSDFVGLFTEEETQEFTAVRQYSKPESVAIPITELRLRWTWAASERLSFGLGANASWWSDVSVPPGVRPGGSLDTLYETTITFAGLVGAIELSF
jgi:hypothetical protein